MATPVFLYKFEGDDLKLKASYSSVSKACRELGLKRTTAGYHLDKEKHYDFGDGVLFPEMLYDDLPEEVKPIAPKVEYSDEEDYGHLEPMPIHAPIKKSWFSRLGEWLFK